MAYAHEYPIYAGEPADRGKIRLALAILAFLLFAGYQVIASRIKAGAWNWAEAWNEFHFITASMPLVILGVLSRFFDEYAWKTSIGRFLFWLYQLPQPQYIGGKYPVTVSWIERGPNRAGSSQAVVTVKQSWRTLIVELTFPDEHGRRAWSMSRMALFEEGPNRDYVTVVYTYLYEGLDERDPQRGLLKLRIAGTCRMTFVRQDDGNWLIDGDYYCDDAGAGRVFSSANPTVGGPPTPQPDRAPAPVTPAPLVDRTPPVAPTGVAANR